MTMYSVLADEYGDQMVGEDLDEFGDQVLFRGEYKKKGCGGAYCGYAWRTIVALSFFNILCVLFVVCVPFVLIFYLAHKKRWRVRLTSKGIYFVQPYMIFPWCSDEERFVAISDISYITECGSGWVTVKSKEQYVYLGDGKTYYEVLAIIGPIKNDQQFIDAFESERQKQHRARKQCERNNNIAE